MKENIKDTVQQVYGQKIRIRACGILIENNRILLARHIGLGPKGELWIPPGGGVQLYESLKQAVKREFQEETNLTVSVGNFLFINEFIAPPLHAIEVFYAVNLISGTLSLGTDPELPKQLLTDLKFFAVDDLRKLDAQILHSLFHNLDSFQKFQPVA